MVAILIPIETTPTKPKVTTNARTRRLRDEIVRQRVRVVDLKPDGSPRCRSPIRVGSGRFNSGSCAGGGENPSPNVSTHSTSKQAHRYPFLGTVYVFRNRRATAVKILCYDGQGFWLCQKRLSKGRFPYWPTHAARLTDRLEAHQLAVLLSGGNPATAQGVPPWRQLEVHC